MADVVGPLLEAIATIVSKSCGAAYRAVADYDGRQVRWITAVAASLAAALYVPLLVGSFFGVRAAWDLFDSEFLWFIGLILIVPVFLMVALAASAVALGVTVGAWLLMDRPGSRWYAGFLAGGAVISGVFVLSMQTWAAQVIGWSTLGLSLALLVAVLAPVVEISAPAGVDDFPGEPPEPEPVDPFTSPPRRTRRFVL